MTKIVATASRYGGEHTIGTITQEQGHFWYAMGNDLFTQYLHWQNIGFEDELNKVWDIPTHLQLPEFYEIDDIEHINAIEFADGNMIEIATEDDEWCDANPHQVIAQLDFSKPEVQKMISANSCSASALYEGDDVVVYAQSLEKGTFNYAFEIEGDFDLSKLKLCLSVWDDLLLVTEIEYDGEMHGVCDGDSWGKGNYAWIDEDTLKGDHDAWCKSHPELMILINTIKRNA